MTSAHNRHVSACARANIAAIEYVDALETGDRYAQEVAYRDFKEAYDEANQAFLDLVKDAFGLRSAA